MVQDFEYGLKNGKIVSARDVPSGINCDCYCPSCGNCFVAYKGKILRPHFKHLAEAHCNYSFETSLHYMAKEIIQEKKYLDLPSVSWELPATLSDWFEVKGNTNKIPLVKTVNWKRVCFDDVEVEKPQGNFKPDLICYTAGKKLLIEITVTHGIDDNKVQKVKNSNVPLLEIDLSCCEHGINRKALKQILYSKKPDKNTERFRWIYNPKIEKLQWGQHQKSMRIFKFLDQNLKLIKLYGRDRAIYNCPLLEKTHTPYKFVDTCQFCTYNLGKVELKNLNENFTKTDWAVMCIGHKKYDLEKLLHECGVNFSSPLISFQCK